MGIKMMGYHAMLLLCAVLTQNSNAQNLQAHVSMNNLTEKAGNSSADKHLSPDNRIGDIVTHPAFQGVGEFLLPRDNNTTYYNTTIKNISSLMPYHNAINPDDIINALNRLIDDAAQGKTIFYSFYSEQQKKQDPSKCGPLLPRFG